MSNTFYSTYVKQDAEILDDLVEAYNQGTMSALIGAGFSMNVSKQYKGWGNLLADAYTFVHGEDIEKEYYEYRQRFEEENQNGNDAEFLSKEKYIANKVNADDLLKLVSKYIEKKGYREAIDGYIEQRTPYAKRTEEGKIELHNCHGKVEDIDEYSFAVHRQLLNCKLFNNIYTTNYDNLLEFTVKNISSHRETEYIYSKATIYSDTELSNYISHHNIIKIHGSLPVDDAHLSFGFDNDNNLNYIIAQEDYDTYMLKHEAFAYLMRIAMLSGTFCLIGFSGADPNYTSWLNWMRNIINKGKKNNPKVFLIDPNPDYKKNENKDEDYCKNLYNKNHHVAILHLFDEKVMKKISPQTAESMNIDYKGEKIKKTTVRELLFQLLKYIEESEKLALIDKRKKEGHRVQENEDTNYSKGIDYYYGDGVAKDYNKAYYYLSQSDTEGAKALLAECYLYGRGTEINLSKAIELCKNNELISSTVLNKIAQFYFFDKEESKENRETAVQFWKESAEKGHLQAQYYLGNCYRNGIIVSEDKPKAFKWYKKAAIQKYPQALFNLGNCYKKGIGVQANGEKAFNLYTDAAKRGHSNAQFQLGNCYRKGIGVQADKLEAVKWYTKAAEQGLSNAQFQLGNCYRKGIGVPEDKSEAVKWYIRAAKQGHSNAQFQLGNCYRTGIGVPEDKSKAAKWYIKAAEQEHVLAKHYLRKYNRYGNNDQEDNSKTNQ